MDTRTVADIGHVRFLGTFVANLVRDLMAPMPPWQIAFDIFLLGLISVVAHLTGAPDVPQIRLIYALVVTLMMLSILSSLWYYLAVWIRWAHIRWVSR